MMMMITYKLKISSVPCCEQVNVNKPVLQVMCATIGELGHVPQLFEQALPKINTKLVACSLYDAHASHSFVQFMTAVLAHLLKL